MLKPVTHRRFEGKALLFINLNIQFNAVNRNLFNKNMHKQ